MKTPCLILKKCFDYEHSDTLSFFDKINNEEKFHPLENSLKTAEKKLKKGLNFVPK
jgi:hypothetical protein